jgi:hypothetical protein
MSETVKPSRRAALTGALVAGAAAIVPAAGALGSPEHPDAALFAVQADIERPIV